MPLVSPGLILAQLSQVNAASIANPFVLVREPSGWWGYHNGKNVLELVESFSRDIPEEQVSIVV